MDEHTVGEVARMSGVSVRTLHHYDAIGLLPASGRTESGYRLYTAPDLERLQRILFYRELEFPLDEIVALLAEPADEHLRRQHRLLRERRDRATALLHALETEMEARQMGIDLTPEERLELFGPEHDARQAEAEQRWGDTEAFRQSQRRTAAYTKDDWVRIKREGQENLEALAAALRDGEPADGPRAMDLAEEARQHITRWFYDCGPAMHRGLAEMYLADPRFTKTYEDVEPGLARFVHDAIVANCARAGV